MVFNYAYLQSVPLVSTQTRSIGLFSPLMTARVF